MSDLVGLPWEAQIFIFNKFPGNDADSGLGTTHSFRTIGLDQRFSTGVAQEFLKYAFSQGQ